MKSKSRAAIWYLKDNTLGRFSQLFPYNDEELTSEQDIFDPQILLDREVPTKHKQLSFPQSAVSCSLFNYSTVMYWGSTTTIEKIIFIYIVELEPWAL